MPRTEILHERRVFSAPNHTFEVQRSTLAPAPSARTRTDGPSLELPGLIPSWKAIMRALRRLRPTALAASKQRERGRAGLAWRAWRGLRCRLRRSSSATDRAASRGWAAARSQRALDTTPPTPSAPRLRDRSPRPSRAASDRWTAEMPAIVGRHREGPVATKRRRPTHVGRETPPWDGLREGSLFER